MREKGQHDAEFARNEAEQVRRLAEEARVIRDQQREAIETAAKDESVYGMRGSQRVSPVKKPRGSGGCPSCATDAVHASVASLQKTLEHMKVVEEMRRILS